MFVLVAAVGCHKMLLSGPATIHNTEVVFSSALNTSRSVLESGTRCCRGQDLNGSSFHNMSLLLYRPELLKLAVELDTIQTLIRLLHSKAASAVGIPSKPEVASGAALSMTSSTGLVPIFKSSAAAAKAARLAAASAAADAAAEDAITLRKGCLLSLAALAMQGDEARQRMIDGGRLLTAVVSGLSDSGSEIRGAAAGCLRGLSRSVKLLRGTSIPTTVAGPLVALLQEEQATDVQVGRNSFCLG